MQTGTDTTRAALIKRLTPYWKMEAANVFFLPVAATATIMYFSDSVSLPVVLTMLSCSSLLVVGTVALRMHLEDVKGNRAFGARALPWLSLAQWPSLGLAIIGLCAAGDERWADGRWTASAVVATILAVLALLEYINYYVVQLQHFDHKADIKRDFSGQGFKEAHLAKALRKYRQGLRHAPR
jgi:hypothetical protein